jgi:S-adenosylmethionine/arginine decarboxylase-like enzyme
MIEYKHTIIRAELEWFWDKNEEIALTNWVRNLIHKLDMNLLAGPMNVYVDRPGLVGWSSVSIIETSHVSLHIWEESKPILCQFDVFTCGKMDPKVVIDHLHPMNPSKLECILIDREFSLKHVEFVQ